MTNRRVTGLPLSVHARLLRQAKEKGEDYNFVLMRYGVERFLYRLSVSSHAKHFVLKGAMLFAAWVGQPHRPTKDVDLLGLHVLSDEELKQAIVDVCTVNVPPDGMRFDADSVQVAPIRDEQAYGGWRVKIRTFLGRSRIPLQVDIGFGDAVVPEPRELDYPGLLDFSPPRILAYPPEAVVAEKFEAMVSLGMTTSRMGDFYDVVWMAENFAFDGPTLAEAIRCTFDRRGTAFPQGLPIALSDEFATNPDKVTQWRAFISTKGLGSRWSNFHSVVDKLRTFFLPLLQAVSSDIEFKSNWPPDGPWSASATSETMK